MNLSLKDEVSVLNIEILGNFEGLIGSDGSISTLNKDVVLSHESFALIFMKNADDYVKLGIRLEPDQDELNAWFAKEYKENDELMKEL